MSKKYKLSHPSCKNVNYINSDEISLKINGEDIVVNRNELSDILSDIKQIQKYHGRYSTNNFFNRDEPKEFKYYSDDLISQAEKYVFGKKRVNAEELSSYEDEKTPYMKLKNMVDSFVRHGLVSKNGDVLINSKDELIEPTIEEID